MVLNAALVLILAGLATAIAGWGAGVYLVLAGLGVVGLWFISLLIRG